MSEGTSQQAIADIPQIAPFDPTKKKKKKKKVVIPHSSVERENMFPLNEGGRNAFPCLTKKKRPEPVHCLTTSDAAGDMCDGGAEDEEEDVLVQQSNYPWEGSERDYEYKELLQRVFSFLLEQNPELVEDKRRSVLRPPQVLPEGTTQTVFVNIMDICKTMHRQPEQLISFLSAKLGTSGSLDRENRLVLRGRFAPQSLEVELQRYINEYVLCNICRSPDTILSKENQIVLLQCDMCGSQQSVAPIGAGYGTRVSREAGILGHKLS